MLWVYFRGPGLIQTTPNTGWRTFWLTMESGQPLCRLNSSVGALNLSSRFLCQPTSSLAPSAPPNSSDLPSPAPAPLRWPTYPYQEAGAAGNGFSASLTHLSGSESRWGGLERHDPRTCAILL